MKRIVSLFIIAALLMVSILSTTSCGGPQNVDNTGDIIEGKYQWSLGSSVGASTYTFDGNKVTNEYYTDGKVTIEYTYVIAVENGVTVIRLTDLSTNKTSSYTFYKGDGYVEISDQRYDLVKE